MSCRRNGRKRKPVKRKQGRKRKPVKKEAGKESSRKEGRKACRRGREDEKSRWDRDALKCRRTEVGRDDSE